MVPIHRNAQLCDIGMQSIEPIENENKKKNKTYEKNKSVTIDQRHWILNVTTYSLSQPHFCNVKRS